MLTSFRLLLVILAIITPFSFALADGDAADVPAPRISNAAWIGHGYVGAESYTALIPTMLDDMARNEVDTLFVNVGKVDAAGNLKSPPEFPTRLDRFFKAMTAGEKRLGRKFKILAWFNGSLETGPNQVDVSKAEVRAALATQSQRMVDASQPGSPLLAERRVFDGVMFDLEPAGGDDILAANLCKLMDEVGAAVGPSRLTAYCAHRLGAAGIYRNTPDFYYAMGQRVNLLCAMTYNAGTKDVMAYQQWMAQQTRTALAALSGRTWKNDAAHAPPAANHRLIMGFGVYPATKWHDPQIESIAAAAQGARQAVSDLEGKEPLARAYFGGAGLYLYADGTGKDGYAGPAEMAAFHNQWVSPTAAEK